MARDFADRGYQSGIGTFDGVAYRDGEMGATMFREHKIPPGGIPITTFWSKTDLENERDVLQSDPSKRFDGGTPDEGMVSDTLTEIEYALQRIEDIPADLVERMQTAVGEDLKQQYQDMGVQGRFVAAIQPEKLRFSANVNDYSNLQAVAEELQPEDRDDLTRSIIYNAIGHDSGPHISLGRRNSPVYTGEAAQYHVAKGAFQRLVEAVNPTSYEVSAPVAEA